MGGALHLGQQVQQRTLFGNRKSLPDDGAFARVKRGEKLVDDLPRRWSDVDESLAAVVGMRKTLDESALLERVEQRRHARRGDQKPLCDDCWLEWLPRALHDRENFSRTLRKLVLVPGLTIVQFDEEISGTAQIGEAFSRQRAGVGKLRLEIRSNSHQRVGSACGPRALR